jgi:hypothetical protein
MVSTPAYVITFYSVLCLIVMQIEWETQQLVVAYRRVQIGNVNLWINIIFVPRVVRWLTDVKLCG